MADPRPSRAALIATKIAKLQLEKDAAAANKQRLAIEEDQRRIAEQRLAIEEAENAGLSTLDRSLKLNVNIALSEIRREIDLDEKEVDEMIFADDEIFIDSTNFWESGSYEPESWKNIESIPSDVGIWKQMCLEAIASRRELDARFCQRSLLALAFKKSYYKKRELLTRAVAQAASSTAQVAVSDKKVASLVSIVKIKAVTTKLCRCTTKCSMSTCGCRGAGVSCLAKCGCHCSDCLNPNTHDDTEEGRAAFNAALTAQSARAALVASDKRELARVSALDAERYRAAMADA